MSPDPETALSQEADSVQQLFRTSAAQQLVRLFLLREELKRTAEVGAQFRRVHVIGAGAMGGDIAAWCALRGLEVTVQDLDAQRIAPVFMRASRLFARHPGQQRAARDRLMADPAGAGVAQADVVIEAVFEDRDVKRDIYRQVEPRLKDGALLATNTSSLCLEELAQELERPSRLLGLHFFNPVARMPLVEVVRFHSEQATDVARAQAFAKRIGRVPLVVRSAPGFLVNRVLLPYLMEAVRMLEEGAPAVLIDRAAKDYGMPMGPLELADTVGLDICLAAGSVLAGAYGLELPDRLRAQVDAGNLGRKSGRGFYVWKKDRAVRARRRPRARLPEDGADRLLLSMVRAAVHCLHENLVEHADWIDAGIVLGTGFAPHRGGPLAGVRAGGAEDMQRRLEELAQRYGDRFAPGPGWGAVALTGAPLS